MGRLNWRRLQIMVGAVALLMLTVAAASAQFTPNFRAPTMVPMMPIGRAIPGFMRHPATSPTFR
jgi:hypothetical protein